MVTILQIRFVSMMMFLACSVAYSTTYYVASNGSDGSDGAAGTRAAPYLTIQKAAGKMAAGDTCYIRTGIYREIVTPAASGVSGRPIVFTAYQGENVFISATDPVTGWTLDKGSIYKATLPWASLGIGRNELFVNGEAMWEARYPNLDAPDSLCSTSEYSDVFLRPCDRVHGGTNTTNAVFNLGSTQGGQENETRLSGTLKMWISRGGSPRPFIDSAWASNPPQNFLAGAIVQKGGGWFTEYGTVVSGWGTDGNGKYISVIPRGPWFFGGICNFFFMGVRALIDEPREWALENGTIYFCPPDGKNPATSGALVEAKHRQLVANFDGRNYINLQGINFLGGSISMNNSNNCLIDDCHGKYITQVTTVSEWDSLDADGLHPWYNNAENGIYIFGNNNTISNSSVEYSCMSGIRVMGIGNLITNCLISNCNTVATFEAGAKIGSNPTGTNTVSHCTIYNMGRSGAMLNENSGQQGFATAPQKFLYNHIYNCQMLSTDGGSFYSCCEGVGWGTEIAYSWFHDMCMVWNPHHIYLDNGDGGFLIHHNVFWQEYGAAENNSYNSDNPMLDRCYNNTALQSPTSEMYIVNDMRGVNGLWANGTYDSVGFNAGANCIANKNFTLKSTSIAIDKGVKVLTNSGFSAGTTTLIPQDGTVFPAPFTIPDTQWTGAAPDLGAYEYGKPAWVPGHTWGTYAWVYPPTGASVLERPLGSAARTVALPRIGLTHDRLRIDAAAQGGCRVSLVDASGRQVAAMKLGAGESRVVKIQSATMGFLKIETSSGTIVRRVSLIPAQ